MKNSAIFCPKVFLLGLILSTILLAHPISVYSENEPNNSIETANTLDVNGSISGSFSNEDNSSDYFKVVTASDGKLTVQVASDAGLCVSLYIYNETGFFTLSNNGSCGYASYSNTITIDNLAAGTYFIQASNYGLGNYSISTVFVAASLPNDTEKNDDIVTALTLGINSEMTGHLGYRNVNIDYYDYYKITTTTDGKLTINLTPDPTLCVDLTIMNETGFYTLYTNGYCYNSTHSNSLVVNNLAAGTYYISTSANGYGSYRISNTLIPTSLNNDVEPNDNIASASILNLNSETTGHLGYKNVFSDDYDYYQITTVNNGKLKITVAPDPTLCINLTLISGDGAYNLYNNGYCGNDSHLDSLVVANLPAGSYYLQSSAVGYGSYRISASYGFASGIAQPDHNGFTIFPNPAKNVLFLSGNDLSNSNFRIYDLTGKTVLTGLLQTVELPYRIDVSDLKHGIYVIELINEKMITQGKFSLE
jgi:hypothetical protein